jgi:hypothetical protein
MTEQINDDMPRPGEVIQPPTIRWYQTQDEINYEHSLKLQCELLTIHTKIDKILEWIASK